MHSKAEVYFKKIKIKTKHHLLLCAQEVSPKPLLHFDSCFSVLI